MLFRKDKRKKYRDNPAVNIYFAAVEEASAARSIGAVLKKDGRNLLIDRDSYPLQRFERIFLAGSGKASIPMAKAVSAVYGEKFAGNLIVSNTGGARFTKMKILNGGHPYPTRQSFSAGTAMHQFFREMELKDFFIYVLSGGTSAMMESSYGGLSFDEWNEMTRTLQNEGLSIYELNILRRKLSQLKGGNLGRITNAHGIVLLISDVLGDDLQTIGSGPFYGSSPEAEDVKKVLLKYELVDKLPKKVLVELMKERSTTEAVSFPHYVLANNRTALSGAAREAKQRGYHTVVVDDRLSGEASDAAFDILKKIRSYTGARPACLLFGGETTVTVKGKGIGGRNQELALNVLLSMRDSDQFDFLSAGTDGIDGPTPFAGAFINRQVLQKAAEKKLDPRQYLERNDSHSFFRELGIGGLDIGQTATNVGDIVVALLP